MGDQGAVRLGEALMFNTSLTSLQLDSMEGERRKIDPEES